jgi:hypothetical protein
MCSPCPALARENDMGVPLLKHYSDIAVAIRRYHPSYVVQDVDAKT